MLCQTTDTASVRSLAPNCSAQRMLFAGQASSIQGQVLPDPDLKTNTFSSSIYSGSLVVITSHYSLLVITAYLSLQLIFYTAVYRDVVVHSSQHIFFIAYTWVALFMCYATSSSMSASSLVSMQTCGCKSPCMLPYSNSVLCSGLYASIAVQI